MDDPNLGELFALQTREKELVRELSAVRRKIKTAVVEFCKQGRYSRDIAAWTGKSGTVRIRTVLTSS